MLPHASPLGSFNGFALKLLALVTMTIDHTAAVLDCGGLYGSMRAIGRIAFPIYCFLLVEGYFHTRSFRKYLGRLLFVFLLSDVPFDLAFSYVWPSPDSNVMLTLSMGLLTVYLMDHSRRYAQALLKAQIPRQVLAGVLMGAFALGGMYLAERCSTDYGGGGVLLIVLFYLFRGHPLPLLLTVPVALYEFFGSVELPGVIALLPIFLYNGKRGPAPGGKAGQWFFYLYYPLHLGVLVLIRFTLYTQPLSLFGTLIG